MLTHQVTQTNRNMSADHDTLQKKFRDWTKLKSNDLYVHMDGRGLLEMFLATFSKGPYCFPMYSSSQAMWMH